MTPQQIKDAAPPKATGYYKEKNSIWYCYIKKGRVIKVVGFMEFSEGWLKYFKYEIKPL